MNRTLRSAAVVAALALTLAACGGDNDSNADEQGGNADLSAQLTWWDTSDPENEGPAFEALIEKFNEEYPNVKIDRQAVPFADAQNKFKTAAEAGAGAPDILRAEVAWVPEFASLGYLYALDGTALLEDEDDYLATPMSSTKFDGKTYGVPQVTDSLALLYNKELFDKAGITEAPQTWEDVKTAAAALKANAGVDGIFINSGGYFLLPFMYGEGGDLVDAEAEKILVNSDANVAGISTAQDLVTSGAAVVPPATDSYGTMMTLFKEQKVGMIINGPWEVNNIRNAPEFGGIENLGVAAVPSGSKQAGAPVGGHDYVIWSGMPEEKADAAIAFVSFLNSPDSQAFLAEELGLLPTRKSAYDLDAVKNNAVISAFKPVADSAVERPWIPEGGQFFGPLDQMATEVLVQGADPKTSLDTVASKYQTEVVPGYTN